MTALTVTAKRDGPLLVALPCRILDADGHELTPPPRKDGTAAQVVALCRCGGSARKPFCDGTHKRNGFTDAPATAPGPPG